MTMETNNPAPAAVPAPQPQPVAEPRVSIDEFKKFKLAVAQIKEAARSRGMKPLRAMALAAVCRGETTFEELERVTLDE